MLKVPKHYFRDRAVLALVSLNVALFVLALLNILFGVDADENPTSIVAYRDTTQYGQISGATTNLYQFGVFVTLVTLISIILSVKLYSHRKYLSIGILGMNLLLLLMSVIIFNALTRTL